jgi:hypothetical protein
MKRFYFIIGIVGVSAILMINQGTAIFPSVQVNRPDDMYRLVRDVSGEAAGTQTTGLIPQTEIVKAALDIKLGLGLTPERCKELADGIANASTSIDLYHSYVRQFIEVMGEKLSLSYPNAQYSLQAPLKALAMFDFVDVMNNVNRLAGKNSKGVMDKLFDLVRSMNLSSYADTEEIGYVNYYLAVFKSLNAVADAVAPIEGGFAAVIDMAKELSRAGHKLVEISLNSFNEEASEQSYIQRDGMFTAILAGLETYETFRDNFRMILRGIPDIYKKFNARVRFLSYNTCLRLATDIADVAAGNTDIFDRYVINFNKVLSYRLAPDKYITSDDSAERVEAIQNFVKLMRKASDEQRIDKLFGLVSLLNDSFLGEGTNVPLYYSRTFLSLEPLIDSLDAAVPEGGFDTVMAMADELAKKNAKLPAVFNSLNRKLSVPVVNSVLINNFSDILGQVPRIWSAFNRDAAWDYLDPINPALCLDIAEQIAIVVADATGSDGDKFDKKFVGYVAKFNSNLGVNLAYNSSVGQYTKEMTADIQSAISSFTRLLLPVEKIAGLGGVDKLFELWLRF